MNQTSLSQLCIKLSVHRGGQQYGIHLIQAGRIYKEEDTANNKSAGLKPVKLLREFMVSTLEQGNYCNATDATKDTISKLILNGQLTGDTLQKHPFPGQNDYVQVMVNTGIETIDDVHKDSLKMLIKDWLDDGQATLKQPDDLTRRARPVPPLDHEVGCCG